MSFQIALSGLNAASTDLQVTSNNIANANTIGLQVAPGRSSPTCSPATPSASATACGLADVRQEFTQGNVDITERQLDLAVSGKGFFVVNDNGSLLYSRVGAFGLDAAGFVRELRGRAPAGVPARAAMAPSTPAR